MLGKEGEEDWSKNQVKYKVMHVATSRGTAGSSLIP